MLQSPASRERALFWLTALLVLGAGFGLRDPWPADEPRFALVARQMVESGQWLLPMRGNELYPDKPPLFMWLQALALSITGSLRASFLLPSLLASLGTLWLVRDLGARLFSREAGAHAAWALLFSVQFTFQARRAQIDPLLVLWVTLSMYAFLRHLLVSPGARWWMLGWFAAGLGVITKGVGVIALFVLLPAAFAWRRQWSGAAVSPGRRFWLGPIALLAPVLAWLVPMLAAVHASGDPALRAYADDILLRQTAKRYAEPWHHHQPFWYYGEVMLTQWWPAVFALPWVLKPWRDALRERDARVLLPLAWVALVVLFFSLSAGKREVYILPALPMLCLALGPWLPGIVEHGSARRFAVGIAALLAGAFALAGAAVLVGEPGFERRFAGARGLADADAFGALLLAIACMGLGALAAFGARRGVAALLATLAAVWIGLGLVGAPLLNDASSARGLMRAVGARIGPQAELGLVAWKEQNALMADRAVATFGFRRPADAQLRDGVAWQHAARSRWLLIEAAALAPCIDPARAVPVGVSNRRSWWLLPTAATRGCIARD